MNCLLHLHALFPLLNRPFAIAAPAPPLALAMTANLSRLQLLSSQKPTSQVVVACSHCSSEAGSTCHSAMHPSWLAVRKARAPPPLLGNAAMLMMQFLCGPPCSGPPLPLLLLALGPESPAAPTPAAVAALLLTADAAAACCSNSLMRADREAAWDRPPALLLLLLAAAIPASTGRATSEN